MITLKPIDRNNFIAILKLSVSVPQQEFVASNSFSLAQSKVQPECVPLAVYDGDVPVGFVMYAMDEDDLEYWIYRVMIDKSCQSRGYGREAMRRLIALIREDTAHRIIYISFEPSNSWAMALYESMGFVPDGRIEDGEIVYRLD
ncbi:MAG: GNAT family N-acetyltransferase [Clostridia bacterium]